MKKLEQIKKQLLLLKDHKNKIKLTAKINKNSVIVTSIGNKAASQNTFVSL